MIRHDTHAIVVWNDRRGRSNWDIYAQAVNLDGKVLWEKDGITYMHKCRRPVHTSHFE